jgi:hypothetical protein
MKLILEYNDNLDLTGITSEELLEDYDKVFNTINDYVCSKSTSDVIQPIKIFSYKDLLADLGSPVFFHKRGRRYFTEEELEDIKKLLKDG